MGASLALGLKKQNSSCSIYGYDYPEVLSEAMESDIIDHRIESWPDQCADADLIFLCTPIEIIEQHLRLLAPLVREDCIVTDIGSTKRKLFEMVQHLDFRGMYIGGHPMTGAEKSGIKAANPLLYENAVYILTNVNRSQRPVMNARLIPMLNSLKARVMLLDAEVHDRIMAVISHVPHLLAIALVNMTGELSNEDVPYFELSAGGFRDMTRVASSSFSMWKEIIASNYENIDQVLGKLIEILQSQKQRLTDLSGDFSKSNYYRAQVPKPGKGFLAPLTDILVYVPDEMGVVAKISNAMADEQIDIRDIELLKIREKEGGVFRLSFETFIKAEEAVKILKTVGYHAFIKE